ncbi:uncharacterized protein LOC124175251 isoform X1 [Neodiprion fabricii]|uniref:uncharacterized protein LOC124175251 isoform X1 n=2 Tax=Neodiprion fabricii TaxID=2872261 RepID=UPI001ED97D4D|nr:uncharacterized protein LOC124175251 isoform X1 [Neodiprion fabricii]
MGVVEAREEEIPSSPVKKNNRGHVNTDKQIVVYENHKVIVMNICKALKEDNPQMSHEKTTTKLIVSRMTGIGKSRTKQITAEYMRTGHVSEPKSKKPRLSVKDKIAELVKNTLRRQVRDFYRNKEMPTADKVAQAVNDDEALSECK